MTVRRIKLRRPATCSTSLGLVPAGDEAMWDAARKTATCIACDGDSVVTPTPGTPGRSAEAKGEELRQRQLDRRQQLKKRHPVIGRLQIALAGPATQGDSWAKGAVGERKLGAALDAMRDQSVLALHDRLIPGSKANIDHIVIGPSGLWVVDAKRYKGLVTTVDTGGWLRSDIRLSVAGRDRTPLIDGVLKQVAHVQRAIDGTPHTGIPVRGALCFVDAEFRLFAKPFHVNGVLVTWGKALRERIATPGDVGEEDRAALHLHLARAFAPA